jgi:hypothetical protein
MWAGSRGATIGTSTPGRASVQATANRLTEVPRPMASVHSSCSLSSTPWRIQFGPASRVMPLPSGQSPPLVAMTRL